MITSLVWNAKACKNGNVKRRGALEGTLYGVPVGGRDIGRSVAYQLGTVSGDVFTVWWDGTVGSDDTGVWPHLYQIDTDASVSLSPSQIAWFDKLENIG